jgi:hypothetical protein
MQAASSRNYDQQATSLSHFIFDQRSGDEKHNEVLCVKECRGAKSNQNNDDPDPAAVPAPARTRFGFNPDHVAATLSISLVLRPLRHASRSPRRASRLHVLLKLCQIDVDQRS